jgi:hypothetical protein
MARRAKFQVSRLRAKDEAKAKVGETFQARNTPP